MRVFKHTSQYMQAFQEETLKKLYTTTWISATSIASILAIFLIRGSASKRKKHISGKKIASSFRTSAKTEPSSL